MAAIASAVLTTATILALLGGVRSGNSDPQAFQPQEEPTAQISSQTEAEPKAEQPAVQTGAEPKVEEPAVQHEIQNGSVYDNIGHSKSGNETLVRIEKITKVRNFLRKFLLIPGIIFDGATTILRIPLTMIVWAGQAFNSFLDLVGYIIIRFYHVQTKLLGTLSEFKIFRPLLILVQRLRTPLVVVGRGIAWAITGLANLFLRFLKTAALVAASIVVEAIHALRFVLTTFVSLPLIALVDFLGSEIDVLKWWHG